MSITATKNASPSVAFFQLNGREIKCFCTPFTTNNVDPYEIVKVAVKPFETWLDEQGYLEVREEVYPSTDHNHTSQETIHWSYTIDEFLHSSTHCYDINELLSCYIKQIFHQK